MYQYMANPRVSDRSPRGGRPPSPSPLLLSADEQRAMYEEAIEKKRTAVVDKVSVVGFVMAWCDMVWRRRDLVRTCRIRIGCLNH